MALPPVTPRDQLQRLLDLARKTARYWWLIAVFAVLGGGFAPTWDLGMFDQVIGFGHAGKLAWMFAGGLFIGFGTRLAGGCTSGHGVCGISRLAPRSFVATLAFMIAGFATVFVVRHVVQ